MVITHSEAITAFKNLHNKFPYSSTIEKLRDKKIYVQVTMVSLYLYFKHLEQRQEAYDRETVGKLWQDLAPFIDIGFSDPDYMIVNRYFDQMYIKTDMLSLHLLRAVKNWDRTQDE